VVRHAHARAARVRFSLSGTFEVEITDDGVGLAAPRPLGIGLVSMRERAEELGGTCVIERRLAGGTRVLARLPLVAPAGEMRPTSSPGVGTGLDAPENGCVVASAPRA